ncbi:uncharacterized protein GIQ15_01758 [Arthroderma uncinatum]|uniref:uncharacterized protein n=1 Tax=Arthroderma uncinatum TaxID=74035 RepID=UPI00144AEC3C|nr:uncharacterized protein GIQ15_01758 [Arthroderma uncinatum]KAF3492241.1 hypothetical protein GIQ15_01758 [Arthroderma uncinatum]
MNMNPQTDVNVNGTGQSNAPPSNMLGDTNPVKAEPTDDSHINGTRNSAENWNEERQLVSALYTLQQMHGKINQLRGLVPARLLGPLKPVITQPPGCDKYQKSPQELCQELSQAARDGMAEIDSFRTSWNSPEMIDILDHVDARLKERNGEYPHMSNVWENDYEEVLASLDREEKQMEEMKLTQQDKLEKDKLESTPGGWRGIVEAFKARNIPGINLQILSFDDTERFSAELQSISITFYVQRTRGAVGHDSEMWHVSMGFQHSQPKLASEVMDCIQSRQRKWDLQYLLEMIASYTNIKRSPCVACRKMINAKAQLPTVRKPKTVAAPNDSAKTIWEAFHPLCV